MPLVWSAVGTGKQLAVGSRSTQERLRRARTYEVFFFRNNPEQICQQGTGLLLIFYDQAPLIGALVPLVHCE